MPSSVITVNTEKIIQARNDKYPNRAKIKDNIVIKRYVTNNPAIRAMIKSSVSIVIYNILLYPLSLLGME